MPARAPPPEPGAAGCCGDAATPHMLRSMTASEPESMQLPHGPVPVQWRRSARARKVSLRIDPRAASVIVTLPMRVAKAQGHALLLAHAGWVAERLSRLPDATCFADGAEVTLHGTPIRIRHAPGRRGAAVEDGTLLVGGATEFLPRRIEDFLRNQARHHLGTLAVAKAALLGTEARRLRRVVIKDTRTRWGSCTADGTVMLSWRLVMAPPTVQDYVVGHEVAHLVHMDHGARFWALVDQVTPHRVAATRWLQAHGTGLMRAG